MTVIPTLVTERLILTAPDGSDWPDFEREFTSDRAQYTTGALGPTMAWIVMASEIGHWHINGFGMFRVVDKATGDNLGFVGPYRPATWPENELGWVLWERAEGRGIAREAAAATRAWAYRTLGWETAVSYIDKNNARSIRLAEHLGCKVDPDAPQNGKDNLVYRHPSPAEVLPGVLA